MKRAAFFLLMLSTFYMAAMYYDMTLKGVFLAEVFLTLGMWVLSRYLKCHVKAEALERSIVGEGTGDLWWSCNITSTAKLPLRSFRIPVRVRYRQETKGRRMLLSGVLEGKSEEVRYQIHAACCGLLYLEMRWLLVYDYLGLFPGRVPFSQEIAAAVLPPRQVLRIEFRSAGWNGKRTGQERQIPYSADERHEVRQLHEYRTGDSSRHIHWNLSARTDKIWIKEYEREAETSVSLLLGIEEAHWRRPERMDAFYRLLYAMALGLLQRVHTVKLCWYDGHSGGLAECAVEKEGQCREMLLDLYKADFSEAGDVGLTKEDAFERLGADSFRLDSGLAWYWGDARIYQFSFENLSEEIENSVFIL